MDKRSSLLDEANIPDYINNSEYLDCLNEARKTADKIRGRQNKNSFTMAVLSDFHYPLNEETKTSAAHAAAALKVISSEIRMDLVVFLGDYVVGDGETKKETELRAAFEITEMMEDAARGIPSLWLNGNHDMLPYGEESEEKSLTPKERFSFIGSRSREVETDVQNPYGNYGYRDFESARVRVIYLNTSDIDYECRSAGEKMKYVISPKQFAFIVRALNLNDKSDASEWSIVFCSHFPIDWPVKTVRNEKGEKYDAEPPMAPKVIEAYARGEAGEVSAGGEIIKYDFRSKNLSKIVASFNGHTHCLNSGVIGESGVVRIAVPNASFGRENEYGQIYGNLRHGEAETYRKSLDGAHDTAFNVVTIDREKGKIYCDCFGAGYDREFDLL